MTGYVPRAAYDARLYGTHAAIGRHPARDELFVVPDSDRYAGMYVIGVQGAGKSGLLHTLIQRDITAGHAVVVFDPHGDLITGCLATIPASRLPQTYVLDLEDESHPFGANLFSSGALQTDAARTTARERILRVFDVLWPDVMGQANLPRYARAATIVLLANPGSTLVDMYELLINPSVRRRLLTRVTDSTVRQFWALYDEMPPSRQQQTIQPLLNRLESLFMGQALVRNVVGQRKSTISFRRVMEHREVIFVRLPLKSLGTEARLIGTILLSQLSAAVFSFRDTPEGERPGISLFVDEAQNFATPDFASLLSEGRKFGIRMVLGHQERGQLPDFLQRATLTARTKVVFTVTPPDARELAPLFANAAGAFEVDEKPVARLLTTGHPDRVVQGFTDYYLRPLRGNRRLLNVTDTTLTWGTALGAVFNSPGVTEPVRVEDPSYALNSLLYEVMRSGDASLPIPREIPMGFSGVGPQPFYQVALRASDELRGQYAFPGWLLKRDPTHGQEQLLHFLFSLRLAMAALAKNPIGEQTEAKVADVGRQLASLPKRAAYVRCDTASGVIYTENTPPRLSGDALQQRLDLIQDQTRRTYCHPREDVEQAAQNTDARSPAAPPSMASLSHDEPTAPPPENPEDPENHDAVVGGAQLEHSRWDDLEEL